MSSHQAHAMFDRRRRNLLQSAPAFGALLWWPRAQACEFMTGTLRVTHPWARATGPGEDTAVLGMRLDEVTEADRLVRVEMPVATGARIGGVGARPTVDLSIEVGQELILDQYGTYVCLTGLKHALLPGRSYPLTLGFEKSGVHIATVSVDYERFR